MAKVALLLAPLTVPGVLFKLWFVFPNNKAKFGVEGIQYVDFNSTIVKFGTFLKPKP